MILWSCRLGAQTLESICSMICLFHQGLLCYHQKLSMKKTGHLWGIIWPVKFLKTPKLNFNSLLLMLKNTTIGSVHQNWILRWLISREFSKMSLAWFLRWTCNKKSNNFMIRRVQINWPANSWKTIKNWSSLETVSANSTKWLNGNYSKEENKKLLIGTSRQRSSKGKLSGFLSWFLWVKSWLTSCRKLARLWTRETFIWWQNYSEWS